MARVLHLLILWLLVRNSESQGYVGSGLDIGASIERILPSVSHRANTSQIFYGIMFDAGSTGTRIHIYTFIQEEPSEGFISFHSLLVGLTENIFIASCFSKYNVCVVVFPDRLPILHSEMFQSVKPGLSAYADMPEKVSKPFSYFVRLVN